jgi:hypothetical protein
MIVEKIAKVLRLPIGELLDWKNLVPEEGS